MEAALRWLADHTPGSAELVRLMDATPVPCGHSVVTARRPDLYGYAGTATAPAIPAGTGAPNYCSSAPATGQSPGSAWPTPS
jgi:hypothetical protein